MENFNNMSEKVFSVIKNWYEKYKKTFFWIIVIGLFAHTFILTNKLVNHDEIQCLFAKGATYSSGRWGLNYVDNIFPNISMSWYNGIITIILISVSACIISEIFDIKSKIFQIIIGGIMVTFPTISLAFAYMFASTANGVSILLAVISVYIVSKKNWKIDFIGIMCLVFSLSIYQAYISLSASILIVLLIKECLNKEQTLKDVIICAIRYFMFLVLSLGIYFILTKLINKHMGIALSTYQGISSVGKFTIREFFAGIVNCYMAMIKIRFGEWGIAFDRVFKLIYVFIMFVNIIFILLCANKVRKENWIKSLIIIFLFLLLPIAMNCVYISSPNLETMYTLMVYGNLMIFILAIILYNDLEDIKFINISKIVLVAILTVVIFKYSTLSNEISMKMYLAYENSYSFFNTLITRINSTTGFDENTRVAIIGEYQGNLMINTDFYFADVKNISGVLNAQQLINGYSMTEMIHIFLGTEYVYVTNEDEINQIKESEEYKEMNIYPYDNSIKMFDDVIVVKFQ